MRWLYTSVTVLLSTLGPAPAHACGGFFCSQKPVDQQAERILFAVGPTSMTMIIQISYRGEAPDFAWVLPIAHVPVADSLGTFPAQALTALDVNTAPMFMRPEDPECFDALLNGGGSDDSTPGVTVHIEETVGPYDVAVIEGTAAGPLVEWLQANGYRVTTAMVPLIERYTAEGMRLLALKLSPNADVSDIEPFRLTLPGGPPSIPLRMTAIAAEPEMGFLVFVLADGRYGPANWSEIEIDPATLLWTSHGWPAETDWLARVAREADEVDGHGWVTELAGPTAPLIAAARATMTRDEEQMRAQEALVGLLEAHPYITRMYARLSPEEMTVDPIFRPRAGGDVAREKMLARHVGGRDLCVGNEVSVCDLTSCGAGADCSVVEAGAWPYRLAGCTCPVGTTARTTFDPGGEVGVVCQDASLSFLDSTAVGVPTEPALPSACAGFDCGDGVCQAVNMTPTCRCRAGSVAIGWLDAGQRRTRCVDPRLPVPADLFANTPVRPGVPVTPPLEEHVALAGGGGCTAARATGNGWPLLLFVLVALRCPRRRGRRGSGLPAAA